MNFMSLLLHASSVFSALKVVEQIAAGCIKDKRAPSNDDDKALIAAIEDLLDAGVISIAGQDEAAIDSALDAVKAKL